MPRVHVLPFRLRSVIPLPVVPEHTGRRSEVLVGCLWSGTIGI